MISKFSFSSKLVSKTLFLFVLVFNQIQAQGDWIDYVVLKDKGVMAVSLDLSLDIQKPNFKNLLVIGTRYNNCLQNGFPKDEGLEELFFFSDSASVAIDKITRNQLVGIITYQCMGFDVFYVKDTIGLRKNLDSMLTKRFNRSKSYIHIKNDKSWDYYYEFLFPKNLTEDLLIDHNYMHDMVLQGDDLKGLRKVDHWIQFKKLKTRNQMGKKLKKLNFSLDSIAYYENRSYPFQLKISRKDSITPSSIMEVTSLLKVMCSSTNAFYDGWGTPVRVKK